jgi:hypothetical protein
VLVKYEKSIAKARPLSLTVGVLYFARSKGNITSTAEGHASCGACFAW